MHENMDIRKEQHCVFMLHAHLVFVTKYRRNIFSKMILDELKTIFESVCKDFNAELVEFDGEKDHVHLLINYAPKVSIAKLVNSLKGVSSHMRGVQAILLAVVEAHLLKSSSSIFNSNKPHFNTLRLISTT